MSINIGSPPTDLSILKGALVDITPNLWNEYLYTHFFITNIVPKHLFKT